jgi:hypothetical protein
VTERRDVTDAPGRRVTRAEVGDRIAEVVEADPDVRIHVAARLHSVPRLPGLAPHGIRVDAAAVHVHLAVTDPHILTLAARLDGAIRPVLAATRFEGAVLHLHFDDLDGDPYRRQPYGGDP